MQTSRKQCAEFSIIRILTTLHQHSTATKQLFLSSSQNSAEHVLLQPTGHINISWPPTNLAKQSFNYRHREGYLLPSIWLFVCLLATSRKDYRVNLCENFAGDASPKEEEMYRFWNSSTSGSRSMVWKNWLDIHKKLPKVYLRTRKSALNFLSRRDPDSRSADRRSWFWPDLRLQSSALSKCSC